VVILSVLNNDYKIIHNNLDYNERGLNCIKMKILVIGGSGVIGYEIVKYYSSLQNKLFYTFLKNNPQRTEGKYLDITQKNEVMKLVSEIAPDIVFHTAAITNVDLCEQEKKLATKINVIGTNNVVDACKKTQSKIVYLSTAAVFDGTKNEYFENDAPSPTSVYGQTKLKGEKIILESKLEYLILRTDQPYGWSEKWQHTNSVLRVVNSLTKKNQFKEIIDWYNTPTYIPDIIKTMNNLINYEKTGIYHVVGNDFLNRFEWALKIAEEFGLNKNLLIPIKSSELKLSVHRKNIKLNNKKLFVDTNVKMSGVIEGLKKMINSKIDV